MSLAGRSKDTIILLAKLLATEAAHSKLSSLELVLSSTAETRDLSVQRLTQKVVTEVRTYQYLH
jgi:hypothetical protein